MTLPSGRDWLFSAKAFAAAMLALYIALPTVSAPDTIFGVAAARGEEIILGILCAIVVGAIVFPMSTGPALSRRMSLWLRDASAWVEEILRGGAAAPVAPTAAVEIQPRTAGSQTASRGDPSSAGPGGIAR
ncbi:MAG: FUSC family protein [Acetobacteraceae bacterium]|nr:FUSC family protein [Acetobacteraceae bacterium]